MKVAFSNKQFIFVLFGALVGYAVMGLPKVLAEEAGTGAWISVLLATIVAVIFTLCITYLNYTHKGKTLFEYSELLLGKTLSRIIMIIYIIYFFGLLTIILRLTSEIIRYTILFDTPYWAIGLAIILFVVFALSKGMNNIVKYSVMIGIYVIIMAVFSHIAVFVEVEWVNLQPVFGTGEAMDYLRGAGMALLCFTGIEILLLLPFSEKNDKKVFWYTGITVGAIGLFYIFIVQSCIGILGIDSIIYYRDALLTAIRRVSIEQLNFLKRFDGISIIAWIMSVITTMIFFGYGVVSLANKFLKSQSGYNWVVMSAGVLVYISSIILPNFELVREWLTYVSYGAVFTSAFVPVLLMIMTKVKGYGKDKA